MTSEKINQLLNDGRHRAIIKEISGCRYLFGFERCSRRSRKYREKLMLTAPLNLTQLVSSHENKKNKEPKNEKEA